MNFYLQSIIFGRANSYATRRGYADEKERAAIVDGWMAGWLAGKRKNARIDKLLESSGNQELADSTAQQP